MNEFKVGLFALLSIAAVAVMSLKVTSSQSGFGDYKTFKTIIRDASGIFEKTPIRVAGISAGRIKKIELDSNQALITFEILDKVRVSEGSELRIKTVGFLGDKFLEVYIGKSQKLLAENSLLPARENGGVEGLMQDASVVMKDVKSVVASLKEAMAPESGRAPMKAMMEDMQKLIENTRIVTSSLRNIVSGNEKSLNTTIANFEKLSQSLADQVNASKDGSAMQGIQDILANAEEMTSNLNELVADIRGGKGTIGKFLVEEEIADDVKQTLASVKKIVGQVDSVRTELSVFSGANTDYGSETSADLKIYPSPERFYVLGLTTSEFGPESERHTTTSVNGGLESTEIKKERDKDSYRFNIQLGRKIQNWSFRGGLIESTGGFGVDYNILSAGTKLTAEVFDYREDIGVNIRLGSEIQMWNVFYGKVNIEDIAEESRSATFSAGLRFNDEDLKGLIGFFL